jgi:hypothetical protein
MKKTRNMMLLAGLFVVIFLVSINAGWAAPHGGGSHHHGGRHHHHDRRHHHHGWRYHHHGWGYYRSYRPVPVPVYPYYYRHYEPAPSQLCYSLTLSVINVLPVVEGKSYVMDVIYNGRLLYKAVPPGERRLLRMQSCASIRNQRMVTIDVKDTRGNFIGSVSRPFYIDSSRAEVWNITLSDIKR